MIFDRYGWSGTCGPDHTRATDLSAPVRGAERARLDRLFGSEVLVGDALRVKRYARDGTIVYSNDHGLIGGRADDRDEFANVVAGHAVRDITHLNHEGGAGENVKVLEVYVPVRLSGRTAGVLELYQDYRPVDAAVRGAMRRSRARRPGRARLQQRRGSAGPATAPRRSRSSCLRSDAGR